MKIASGDLVTMRKPHACGCRVWEITRTGADVAAVCTQCRRRIMMDREKFERQVVEVKGSKEPGDG